MRKFLLALALLALLGGLVGATTAQASSAPSATFIAYQGMGQLTLFADPMSPFVVWDTAPDGTHYPVMAGRVDQSGMSQVMVPMTYNSPTLVVAVYSPQGGPPAFVTVVKDDRWIWD